MNLLAFSITARSRLVYRTADGSPLFPHGNAAKLDDGGGRPRFHFRSRAWPIKAADLESDHQAVGRTAEAIGEDIPGFRYYPAFCFVTCDGAVVTFDNSPRAA
jgi:hypothetical protein